NNQLLSADGQGMLKVWSINKVKKGNKEETELKIVKMWEAHGGGVTTLALHTNGTQALSGGADKVVKLWNLADRKVIRAYGPLAEPVSAVSFNRDFNQVAAAGGKTVKVWNLPDGKEVLTLASPAAVSSLSFNFDRTRVAVGGNDQIVRVFDVATGKE